VIFAPDFNTKIKTILLMKMRTKQILLLCFLLLLQGGIYLNAQVTIGSLFEPAQGALLQLKQTAEPLTEDNKDDIRSFVNTTKGLLFPRVNLEAFDQLAPLYAGTQLDDGTWTGLAHETDPLMATGTVVFNVNGSAIGLSVGLYVWDVKEWRKMTDNMAEAVISPVECDSVKIYGTYTQGVDVTASNYMEITLLNVERPGTYSIAAITTNGYGFYISGAVVNKGRTTLKLPAQGRPTQGGRSDNLVFTGLEFTGSCIKSVYVEPGNFTLEVAVDSVGGIYKRDLPTGSIPQWPNQVYFDIYVSEPKTGVSITSIDTWGISFQDTILNLHEGNNHVAIPAISGRVPLKATDFYIPFTITAGTKTEYPKVKIPVTLPKMTFANVGTDATYSFYSTERRSALYQKGYAFGNNVYSKVKIESFTQLWAAKNVYTAASYNQPPQANESNNSAYWQLYNELQKRYAHKADQSNPDGVLPDIVLYFAYDVSGSDSEKLAFATILRDYITEGGTVIYGAEDNKPAQVNIILKGVFNLSTDIAQKQGSAVNGTGSDDFDYQIVNNADVDDMSNPVVHGAFGNLSGTYWGEDNATVNSIVVKTLPDDGIQVCSARNTYGHTNKNPAYSIVWYSNNHNFFYFGDTCGSASHTNTSQDGWPSIYNSTTGMPQSKVYGPNSSHRQTVYNSALELNAVEWAIRIAAEHGINYPPIVP
jgi:hypothetical protein